MSWVDEFIDNVRPYITVREEDNLLIRMPNQAHKLNPQGVRVLRHLLDGGSVSELTGCAMDSRQVEDIGLFLFEVRRCLEGTLREDNHTRAVEVMPLEVNFSELPVLSEVAVTSRCNLSCVFCYAGCSCLAWPGGNGGEMTTAEVMEVLGRIYNDAKVPSVSFTGGEPTLRGDLPELIEYARGIGMRVNLITNGTRIDGDYARRLAAAGLHSAQVSLEGTNAATHDVITGAPGSFERSVAAVGYLSATGITVHTNTTLNRGNFDDAPRLPAFVSGRLGLERFSMNLIIPSGSAVVNTDAGESSGAGSAGSAILVRYSEVEPLLNQVIAASEQHGVEFMWYSPTPLCIFNPITHGLGNKGCSACDGLLSVDPSGDVLPCSSWADPVGNMLEDDFDRIWQSSRARSYRRKEAAHQHCRTGCDSFAVCHGACPLYWEHFSFSELEERI